MVAENSSHLGSPGPSTHPRYHKGFCVWFTGLSGAGKSTTAEALAALLSARGRPVTLLDGDVVRTHLSRGLGFSRDDRITNLRRIAFVASEVVRHGGAVVCAAISPYRSTRTECRARVGTNRFVEVFVDAPLEVCIRRDPKGLYARARRGEITDMTGVQAPYERPDSPDITLDAVAQTARENAARVLEFLAARDWL